MADPKKIAEENKSLKEQIQLLRDRNKLQEDSLDISSSVLDSLKEVLGIQSRSSTFEKATLKTNQDINASILNQKTGLSDISTIQRQIQKNEDLLKKSKLIESGLLSSIGGKLSQNAKIIEGRIKKQATQQKQLSEYNKKIEEGVAIDIQSYNQLKQKISLQDDLISQGFQNLSSLEQQIILTQQNTKALEEQQEVRKGEEAIQKQIEKRLGIIGIATKGLGAIPGIGRSSAEAMAEVTEEIQKQVEESGKLPSRWKTFGMIAGKTVKNISSSLTDPAVMITGLISIFKELDDTGEKFSRSMNMTYKESLTFRDNMSAVAGVTKGQLLESISAVGTQLGSNAAITEKDAATFTKLREYAGLTNEELMGMQSISLANGKSLEKNTNQFLAQSKATAATNGVILNEKQLLAEVGKISAATTLSLGKNPKELAKAVATAKALGMEMGQLENIAGGLLDFESSIENELAAELLTGKDLNLEKARQLALNNDIAGMAQEINNQIGTSADYTKMNRIQQEALAKSVGMNREELAQTLFTQEQLKGLSGDEAADRQALLDQRIEEVGLAQAQREIEAGGVEELKKQAGIQTSFNQVMLELKDTLASGILPIFATIAGFITDHMNMVKVIAAVYLGMKVTLGVMNALNMVGLAIDRKRKKTAEKEAAVEIIGSAAKIGGSFGPLGIAIAAGIVATGLASLAMFQGDDVMSPGGSGGGYGSRTLFGPEGAIQLNNKDTVIAGTNLFDKGDDVMSGPKGSLQIASNNSSNSSDMKDLKEAMIAMANRPVNVGIDGEQVLKATTGKYSNTFGDEVGKNSYKIQ
jgi:hypothetical protein